MRGDEAVLIKTYDSDFSVARFSAHTAFADPTYPAPEILRDLIARARALVARLQLHLDLSAVAVAGAAESAGSAASAASAAYADSTADARGPPGRRGWRRGEVARSRLRREVPLNRPSSEPDVRRTPMTLAEGSLPAMAMLPEVRSAPAHPAQGPAAPPRPPQRAAGLHFRP